MNIITGQMIPRISGDALANKGFEIGLIMLQGDIVQIENRNIIDTPFK